MAVDSLTLITKAENYGSRGAIVDSTGQFTYAQLLAASAQIASKLLSAQGSPQRDLHEARVAILVPSGFNYVAAQWGIWRAGGLAVPLCITHPQPELAYVLDHAGVSVVIADPRFLDLIEPLTIERNIQLWNVAELYALETDAAVIESISDQYQLPLIAEDRRALMLYTSGTTGKPKGVVTTHQQIAAQVTSLVTAWQWTDADKILHVLPLHHIHGIVNALTCALWVGAQCHMMPKFDPLAVWHRFAVGDLTLFMAVPTIYRKLITAWDQLPDVPQKLGAAGCQKMRLMVSGSAALSVGILQEWEAISGHILLERYGMTEIGMALSNPYGGERRVGYVGQPLPGVTVRLIDHEIQVRSAGVFQEYWQNPAATAASFKDGWFCTGDAAVIEDGSYRILGRQSIDIIKTGGYKVSALEIEEVLRSHSMIADAAVVGIDDEEWGQKVVAALILQPKLGETNTITLSELRQWAKARIAVYKVPQNILILDELPRNAMGKVVKPELAKLFN
ncbi:MAG: acyl-CoA synthetase [Pseudanabaena sp. ELA607]